MPMKLIIWNGRGSKEHKGKKKTQVFDIKKKYERRGKEEKYQITGQNGDRNSRVAFRLHVI